MPAIVEFFTDREYFDNLFRLALPIALQNFIFSLLNMAAMMMIGQLGEASVAAVGLAGQISFLLNLLLFGITSGAAMFTAQFWGKGDRTSIHRVLGICLVVGGISGLVFLGIAILIPETVLGIYSKDVEVIALGSGYLRIFGWSFIFVAITTSFAAVLRSTGDVKTPLVVSIAALSFNVLLSFGLIFGKFGLPALGIRGAAVATLIARFLECLALLWLAYSRRTPAAAPLRQILDFDLSFIIRILKPVLPVAINELLWAFGITTYYAIYARIGTESVAAMNIASTIDQLALVLFIGIGNACAVLVGHAIGAGEEDRAFRYAGHSLVLSMLGALLMGGLILLVSGFILGFYKVSPTVIQNAHNILVIIALFLWVRVANMMLFLGIFRAGGDTRVAFVLDAGMIWVIGVPLALLGAFVFHLPVHWVYLMVMVDEVSKWAIGLRRFVSRKWIHNLTHI